MNQKTFKEKIYLLTSQIPKSKVATYGQLAKMAGHPKAARAVGLLMKNNPNLPIVPCHRVVSSNGELTGYSSGKGIATKKSILISEGVIFKNDKVDLSQSLWQP